MRVHVVAHQTCRQVRTAVIRIFKRHNFVASGVAFSQFYACFYGFAARIHAARNYPDDVPEDVKSRRLQEIIQLQTQLSLESNQRDVGKTFEVLIEGRSKKSPDRLYGRNSQNKVIVFNREDKQKGEYVQVKVTDCTSATLMGELVSDD